jgi:hypothetical protein
MKNIQPINKQFYRVSTFSGEVQVLEIMKSIFATLRRDKSASAALRRDKSVFVTLRRDKSVFAALRRDKDDCAPEEVEEDWDV